MSTYDQKYLQHALALAQASFNHGEFPAGALVVSGDDETFESSDSFGWNHAEAQSVDKALTKFGPNLAKCTLYTTMQPCLGCISKIYWGGIRKIVYILPQNSVDVTLCYEGKYNIQEILNTFNEQIQLIQDDTYAVETLAMYQNWERKIGVRVA